MSFGNSPGKRLAAHQLAAKALRKVALVSEAWRNDPQECETDWDIYKYIYTLW